MFMDDHTLAQIAPGGDFGNTFTINCDNPFLSAQQFGVICGNPENIINGFLGNFPLAQGAPFNPNPGAAPLTFFDARGNTGPVFMFETSPNNGWLIERFGEAAQVTIGRVFVVLMTVVVMESRSLRSPASSRLPCSSDFRDLRRSRRCWPRPCSGGAARNGERLR